jgi:hypothetical protein
MKVVAETVNEMLGLWFHGSATTTVGFHIGKDQTRNLAKIPTRNKK